MAAKTKPLPADVITRQTQYAELGLTDAQNYKTLNELDAALVKNVYKLDPLAYTGKKGVVDVAKARTKYEFEQPKLSEFSGLEPNSFTQSVSNYSRAIRKVQELGAENVNKKDLKTIELLARQIRDFDSPSLSENAKQIITNIGDVVDAVNSINNQRELVETQRLRSLGLEKDGVTKIKLSNKEREAARNRLTTEQDAYSRLVNTANQSAPKLEESLTRFGLSDIARGIGAPIAGAKQVDTGLEALRGDRIFQTGNLLGKLGSQVTDDQILSDINTARRNEYKGLYDIGTAAVTDLQSQLSVANQFLADLPAGDRRRADAQKTIDSLNTELAEAQKDTLEAKNLYENYQPVSGTQATTALSQFRESLRLPEQRTLDQIREIDPNLFNTITQLSKQYGELSAQPIGPTTAESTEALRRETEARIAGQVALGSQLGAEEQRQYQQAARAAQTARGNVFGVAPAVEEAVTTGLAGEQRLQARLGAAQGFLSSGQSVSDALARDVSLRNALQQSRLGAAAEFAAAGPSPYNLATQRFAQQQGLLQNYMAAAQPQATQPFQATPSAMVPYAYTDPMAGFRGAQNAAQIYGDLARYQADTYGAQTRAMASTYTSPSQAFGNIASGLGSMFNFGGTIPIGCWVAREVYGEDNPKWMQFRSWLLEKAPRWLVDAYCKFGPAVARFISNKPWLKSIIRIWMDERIKSHGNV